MRKSCTFRQSALRFKRWSRKAYAAFISIRRTVTIGRLSSHITERFQQKNLSLHAGIQFLTEGFFAPDEEEGMAYAGQATSLCLSEWQASVLIPIQASNEVAHPAVIHTRIM